MKQICELNDKIILGQDGLSNMAPRITARAIVKNQDGLYAVMYADKFKLHSLPGGGVDTMVIAGKEFRGVELRQKLGLYSTTFSIVPEKNTVHIYTKGFGHRVGMSQYGAEAMAVSGKDYVQILAHYYPGTELDSYLD